MCEWQGCKHKGPHRAPKGRENEREYWRFCIEHVREYNQSYNFFSGMSDDAVARYQKDALTGHRPTWKMGANSAPRGKPAPRTIRRRRRSVQHVQRTQRPRQLAAGSGSEAGAEARKVMNAERKALQVMGLDRRCHAADIKALQGAGEAAPPRRQRRRPLDRGPPDRDHQGV